MIHLRRRKATDQIIVKKRQGFLVVYITVVGLRNVESEVTTRKRTDAM